MLLVHRNPNLGMTQNQTERCMMSICTKIHKSIHTRIRIIHKIFLICIGKDQFTKLTKQFNCIKGKKNTKSNKFDFRFFFFQFSQQLKKTSNETLIGHNA